jgi:serine/threonine-protein phosphatase CPPED1
MQHRIFLFRITLILFLIFAFCHASPQQNGQDAPWFFIQLTDPQMGMYENNQGFEKETALLEKAVAGINRLHPDFLVITGDFVHNLNSIDQIQEFKRIVATIDPGIPVYFTPGNHDIGQNPDTKSLENYRQNYGSDRFAFQHKGSALIGINTSFIKARMELQEQKQLRWLEKALKRNRIATHRILFCHFPFYNSTPEEAESYSNIAPDYRAKYLSLFEVKGVDAVFSGHLHNNREFKNGNILLVTTSSLGKPLGDAPSGLRIVKIYNDRIESGYYGIEELPEYVQFDR